MKYLIVFLVTLSSGGLSQINNDTCLFEGVLKVKNEFPDGDTLVNLITISKNIVRIDSDNSETIITDYQDAYSKYFDKDGNLASQVDFDEGIHSTTTKLNIPKKIILGYECTPYENITEEMYHFGEITQIKTIFWVTDELNSCLYSKYKRLNLLFSNPLDKIALRTERQIVENGTKLERIIVSEIQEITPKKIDYDLRDINNK